MDGRCHLGSVSSARTIYLCENALSLQYSPLLQTVVRSLERPTNTKRRRQDDLVCFLSEHFARLKITQKLGSANQPHSQGALRQSTEICSECPFTPALEMPNKK